MLCVETNKNKLNHKILSKYFPSKGEKDFCNSHLKEWKFKWLIDIPAEFNFYWYITWSCSFNHLLFFPFGRSREGKEIIENHFYLWNKSSLSIIYVWLSYHSYSHPHILTNPHILKSIVKSVTQINFIWENIDISYKLRQGKNLFSQQQIDVLLIKARCSFSIYSSSSPTIANFTLINWFANSQEFRC